MITILVDHKDKNNLMIYTKNREHFFVFDCFKEYIQMCQLIYSTKVPDYETRELEPYLILPKVENL